MEKQGQEKENDLRIELPLRGLRVKAEIIVKTMWKLNQQFPDSKKTFISFRINLSNMEKQGKAKENDLRIELPLRGLRVKAEKIV